MRSEIFLSRHSQRGVTLIIVMVILVIVTLLGIGGAQLVLSGERSTRYDRDYLIAQQAAEAAIKDAETDISTGSVRSALFTQGNLLPFSSTTCGTGAVNTATSVKGLCASPLPTAKPIWAIVDFTNTSTSAPTVAFGDFTNRIFQAGSAGVQPSQLPRYIIEYQADQCPGCSAGGTPANIYRITAVGFGPNPQVQVVVQTGFRKP